MLQINEELFIGKGFHRNCYQLPDDEQRCIKIAYKQPENKSKRGKLGAEKAIKREINHYKALNKKMTDWRMLAKYFGHVSTNLGVGHVFKLVKDRNGEVSKTLEQYLLDNSTTVEELKIIERLIPRLKEYLIENHILTQKILARNVVFQQQDEPLLVIIDDIGNSEFIPLSTYSKYFARKKIERVFSRFRLHLKNVYLQENTGKHTKALLNRL